MWSDPTGRLGPVVLLASMTLGCGHAVLQTAHTEPKGTAAVTLAAAAAFNALDEEAQRNLTTNAVGETTLRVGITDNVDVGIGGYFFPGFQADVKVNVFNRHRRHALAPRLGGGCSNNVGDLTYLSYGGVIGSYRVAEFFEPYLALTLSDQWVRLSDPAPADLAPNEELAPRHGTGNGMLRATLGAQLNTSQRFGFLLEYGRWEPLWNDPGDGYKFLRNNIVAIGFRISGKERRGADD